MIAGCSWTLELFPGGLKEDPGEQFDDPKVAIQIRLASTPPHSARGVAGINVRAKFTIRIGSLKRDSQGSKIWANMETKHGFSGFCSRDSLLSSDGDRLLISCQMEVSDQTARSNPRMMPASSSSTLSNDMLALFTKSQSAASGTDVVVVANGHRIRTHSVILSLRAPAFWKSLVKLEASAFILCNIAMATSEPADVAMHLLEFIYSDNIDKDLCSAPAKQELLRQLSEASVTYELPRLTMLCNELAVASRSTATERNCCYDTSNGTTTPKRKRKRKRNIDREHDCNYSQSKIGTAKIGTAKIRPAPLEVNQPQGTPQPLQLSLPPQPPHLQPLPQWENCWGTDLPLSSPSSSLMSPDSIYFGREWGGDNTSAPPDRYIFDPILDELGKELDQEMSEGQSIYFDGNLLVSDGQQSRVAEAEIEGSAAEGALDGVAVAETKLAVTQAAEDSRATTVSMDGHVDDHVGGHIGGSCASAQRPADEKRRRSKRETGEISKSARSNCEGGESSGLIDDGIEKIGPEVHDSIRATIRGLMTQHGLQQKQVAAQAGLSSTSLSLWLNGKQDSRYSLVRLRVWAKSGKWKACASSTMGAGTKNPKTSLPRLIEWQMRMHAAAVAAAGQAMVRLQQQQMQTSTLADGENGMQKVQKAQTMPLLPPPSLYPGYFMSHPGLLPGMAGCKLPLPPSSAKFLGPMAAAPPALSQADIAALKLKRH
jgi:hypothetical protein